MTGAARAAGWRSRKGRAKANFLAVPAPAGVNLAAGAKPQIGAHSRGRASGKQSRPAEWAAAALAAPAPAQCHSSRRQPLNGCGSLASPVAASSFHAPARGTRKDNERAPNTWPGADLSTGRIPRAELGAQGRPEMPRSLLAPVASRPESRAARLGHSAGWSCARARALPQTLLKAAGGMQSRPRANEVISGHDRPIAS